MRIQRAALCLAALATLVAGCGQTQMVAATGQMRSYMLQGNYQAALATLRQSKTDKAFKEQDRVVYWMNEGMLLHLTGQYAESNKVLEQAEQRAKELYTKSISKGIKAAFTSDAATDYAGEDYENVLLNVVKALNFMALNNLSEALVEARKINEKLALFNTRYEKKNTYNQDAFAHWLMGLLFEMERSFDDARIAYVHALETYQNDFSGNYGMRVPSYLGEDVVRASILSGSREDAEKYKGELGAAGTTAEALKTQGEIVLVHLNGEGPSKTDFFINCYFQSIAAWYCDAEPGGEFMKKTTITIGKGTAVKVAFPQLILRQPVNPSITMTAGGVSARTEPAEPISAIAQKTLADKTGRIFKDAIIRVITKTLTTVAAEKTGEALPGGKLTGFLAKNAASATMQATEEADKRAWITLPSRIDVARLMVPPGTYDVSFALPRGGYTQPVRGVKVEAGKRVVLTQLTIP